MALNPTGRGARDANLAARRRLSSNTAELQVTSIATHPDSHKAVVLRMPPFKDEHILVSPAHAGAISAPHPLFPEF